MIQVERKKQIQQKRHWPFAQCPNVARILDEILGSVRNPTKKHPDAIVNLYKVTKINNNLSEIRERYQDSGYEDLLEMIDLPREVIKDGATVTEGVTYSDLEVLLDHYHTILYYI